jgi:hypothetical protein
MHSLFLLIFYKINLKVKCFLLMLNLIKIVAFWQKIKCFRLSFSYFRLLIAQILDVMSEVGIFFQLLIIFILFRFSTFFTFFFLYIYIYLCACVWMCHFIFFFYPFMFNFIFLSYLLWYLCFFLLFLFFLLFFI